MKILFSDFHFITKNVKNGEEQKTLVSKDAPLGETEVWLQSTFHSSVGNIPFLAEFLK